MTANMVGLAGQASIPTSPIGEGPLTRPSAGSAPRGGASAQSQILPFWGRWLANGETEGAAVRRPPNSYFPVSSFTSAVRP